MENMEKLKKFKSQRQKQSVICERMPRRSSVLNLKIIQAIGAAQ
jgi:hypothetical protein